MSFYPDAPAFYDVMTELFQRLANKPGATDDFARSRLVIHINVTEPQAFIGLNARTHPIGFHFEADGARPDISLFMTADLLHQVWLGKVRLRDAFFGGQIKTKGAIFKAMQLAPLFREAEALYPTVLAEKGR